MDNEKKDGQDGKACCDKSKCCGGKALAAIALLAIGATGGYLAGKCGASKCAVPAAVEAPAK
ncbi:MAG: hypothetical protein HYX59_03585 [Elusimicrobia bacterium]|nr:hypothetical protein [Elusimicrobiota bacterium]